MSGYYLLPVCLLLWLKSASTCLLWLLPTLTDLRTNFLISLTWTLQKYPQAFILWSGWLSYPAPWTEEPVVSCCWITQHRLYNLIQYPAFYNVRSFSRSRSSREARLKQPESHSFCATLCPPPFFRKLEWLLIMNSRSWLPLDTPPPPTRVSDYTHCSGFVWAWPYLSSLCPFCAAYRGGWGAGWAEVISKKALHINLGGPMEVCRTHWKIQGGHV